MFHQNDSSSLGRVRSRFAALGLLAAMVLGSSAVPAQFQRPTPMQYTGTNYLPATSMGFSNALNMLSADGVSLAGAFSPNQIRAEVAQISKAGLNSIRIFPSFYGYLVNPADYLANLKVLANACREWRVQITYVMWNTISNVFVPLYIAVDPNVNVTYDAPLHQILQSLASAYTLSGSNVPYAAVLGFGEPWQYVLHDEPGNGLFEPPYNGVMSTWPNNLKAKIERYIDDIGQFFATDPDGQAAFGSYDIFNENDCCQLIFLQQMELITTTYKRLERKHRLPGAPQPEFTLGFANYNNTLQNHNTLLSHGVRQTYLSYHCYEQRPLFSQVAQMNAAFGQQAGLPVICSEFYDRNRPNHLGDLPNFIGDLKANGIGGQVWGYLATNLIIPDPLYRRGRFVRIDGMVIPSAVPITSFSSSIFFLLSAGAAVDVQALRTW